MEQAIGIRLPKEMLMQIEELGKEEIEDRSTVIRKLIIRGYKDTMLQKAAQAYKEGKITLSKASQKAGLTLWEMECYLIGHGFKSSYSVEDLEKELKSLK